MPFLGEILLGKQQWLVQLPAHSAMCFGIDQNLAMICLLEAGIHRHSHPHVAYNAEYTNTAFASYCCMTTRLL